MSGKAVSGTIIAVLITTTAGFAGLFDYQYLKRQDASEKTNQCPYYPQPQPLDFEVPEFTELFDWLDNYMSSLVNETTKPSIVANVVYRDEIIWKGHYGRVNKDSVEKPNENTIYRIGSVSKIFPVIFLFKLWEEGKLDIYDPISKYAPDFKMIYPFGGNSVIRLIDVASQLAGLPPLLPFDAKAQFNGTLEQALAILHKGILVAEPRTKCFYSNMAYPLLTEILSRNFTADRNFENWARKNIIDPLGLSNTGFQITANVKTKMAKGYEVSGNEAPLIDLKWYRPSSNYYSSAADIAKLSMSFMETSTTILKHETLEEMQKARQICRRGYLANFTGSPWEINNQHSYVVVKKVGAIFGYTAVMAMVPDLKLAFNVLVSGFAGTKLEYIPLDRMIPKFRDTLRKKKPILRSTPRPEKYIGLYTVNADYMNITLNEDGEIVLFRINVTDSRIQNMGLSYISETIFKIYFLEEFPCFYHPADIPNKPAFKQHESLIQFRNFTSGKYQQFDIPEYVQEQTPAVLKK